MNPELVICTLDDGAHLDMELTVENGKGYVAGSLRTGRRMRRSA